MEQRVARISLSIVLSGIMLAVLAPPVFAADPQHCIVVTGTDANPNSCYHLGSGAGMDAAYHYIHKCHMINALPPPPHHSTEYQTGWYDGWQDANNADEDDNCTLGATQGK
ncbi:MAG: hypothetical protein WA667_00060 [Candidatus Nitrosopolaris sp.]